MQNPEEPLEVKDNAVTGKGVPSGLKALLRKIIKWFTVVFFSLLSNCQR